MRCRGERWLWVVFCFLGEGVWVFSPLRLDGLGWTGFLHSVGVVID